MKHYEFELKNEHGLHARPAGLFVQVSGKFQSAISLHKGEIKVNGKSLLGLMKMAASKGDLIKLEIDGADEEEALTSLVQLINNNFDE
jgi:phosphocarrier protein